MMQLFARLVCWHKGHKRGKLVQTTAHGKVFECPRCKRRTTYKVKQ